MKLEILPTVALASWIWVGRDTAHRDEESSTTRTLFYPLVTNEASESGSNAFTPGGPQWTNSDTVLSNKVVMVMHFNSIGVNDALLTTSHCCRIAW